MICPYCAYKDSWITDEGEYKESDSGSFYKLPVTLTRHVRYNEEAKSLYGCPSCNKTFLEK